MASAMQKWLNQSIFRIVSWVGPRNRVLDGRTRWRHLANTVEPLCTAAMSGSATRDGNMVCSQITLDNPVFSY